MRAAPDSNGVEGDTFVLAGIGGIPRRHRSLDGFTTHLAILLARELNAFSRELDLFPDDRTVWKTAPGATNSAANLALHVAGNLQHFVGAVLGATG